MTTLFAATALRGTGYDYQRVGAADLDALRSAAGSRPGADVGDVPMLTIVEVAAESTVFLFTREGHFAHPAALVRRIVQPPSGPELEVFGYGACDDEAMRRWLDQFRRADDGDVKMLRPLD